MEQLPKVGQLIEKGQQRDAIHMAIAPVVANELLKPGQHVGFVKAGNQEAVGICTKPIGIIDPFLDKPVNVGQRCYLFLYPGTVTGLRHEWTHPAFEISDAQKWLQEFAERWEFDYSGLLEEAASKSPEFFAGTENYDMQQSEKDQFWEHVQTVIGYRFSAEHREKASWRCGC